MPLTEAALSCRKAHNAQASHLKDSRESSFVLHSDLSICFSFVSLGPSLLPTPTTAPYWIALESRIKPRTPFLLSKHHLPGKCISPKPVK